MSSGPASPSPASPGPSSPGPPSGGAASTAELHDVAVRLARGAGDFVTDRLREAGPGGRIATLASKSTPTDLVTEVDRATEAWLLERIGAWRPGDAVLGEERGAADGSTGVRWVLDPIDGTVNFVLGLPEFAVSVAAEVDGVVVAGAVHAPRTGETYSARRGGGSWLDGRRLTGPREVPLARAVVGTGFGYDATRRRAQADVMARLIDRIADVRRIGSASLDLCAVGAGRLDGYYEVGLNPWDWAAGLLVATEAGAVASGLRGREPGTAMTAVASPAFATDFFRTLEELDADVPL